MDHPVSATTMKVLTAEIFRKVFMSSPSALLDSTEIEKGIDKPPQETQRNPIAAAGRKQVNACRGFDGR
jgi:hypothetical protein